jgi:hypothetical protein
LFIFFVVIQNVTTIDSVLGSVTLGKNNKAFAFAAPFKGLPETSSYARGASLLLIINYFQVLLQKQSSRILNNLRISQNHSSF